MKKLIILIMILFCVSIFAQVSIDSTNAITSGNTITLYGYSTFVTTPSAEDYDVGFLFGTSYNDLNYIPMGDFSWNQSTLQLTHWTTVTNLELTSKHYYTPYIQPKSAISKFEVDGTDGWENDIICEPVIESASANKSMTQPIGETITFNVTVEQKEETCSYNYQWEYKLATEITTYDTVETVIDTVLSYTYPESWSNIGENLNEWETPALQNNFHYAKVRCRVYNSSGEDISIEGLIKIDPASLN